MDHPPPVFNLRLRLRAALAEVEACRPHAPTIAAAGRMATISRDLKALIESVSLKRR
jgi:hypothetical protein